MEISKNTLETRKFDEKQRVFIKNREKIEKT